MRAVVALTIWHILGFIRYISCHGLTLNTLSPVLELGGLPLWNSPRQCAKHDSCLQFDRNNWEKLMQRLSEKDKRTRGMKKLWKIEEKNSGHSPLKTCSSPNPNYTITSFSNYSHNWDPWNSIARSYPKTNHFSFYFFSWRGLWTPSSKSTICRCCKWPKGEGAN